MICPWSSVSLPPIGVPSDYELDVDWPLVLPDLPNDDDDEEPDEDAGALPVLFRSGRRLKKSAFDDLQEYYEGNTK